MTLEYKILWIDDDPESVESKKLQVKEYIEDEKGFDCKIISIESYKEYVQKYGTGNINDFDLLIVDFKLDDEEVSQEEHSGFDIIQDIRDTKKIYTEVIFYSSQYGDLIDKIKSPDGYIEGIFTSTRDELIIKTQEIVDVLIKKVQDVNNLRGLIMAEVSELDRIKKRIIQKFNKEADINFKKYIKNKVFSKIRGDLESLKCLVKVEDSECNPDEINLEELQKNFFYDSYKKSRTVYKIKRLKCKDIAFTHEDYKKDVIDKRNVLAHEEEKTRESDGIKILKYPKTNKKEDLEFTEEECIKIRKDIKKYKKLLEDINQRLYE